MRLREKIVSQLHLNKATYWGRNYNTRQSPNGLVIQPNEKNKKLVAYLASTFLREGSIPARFNKQVAQRVNGLSSAFWNTKHQRALLSCLKKNSLRRLKITLRQRINPWVPSEVWAKMTRAAKRLHKRTKKKQRALRRMAAINRYKPIKYRKGPISKKFSRKISRRVRRILKKKFKRRIRVRVKRRHKTWAWAEVRRRKMLKRKEVWSAPLFNDDRLHFNNLLFMRDALYLNKEVHWLLEKGRTVINIQTKIYPTSGAITRAFYEKNIAESTFVKLYTRSWRPRYLDVVHFPTFTYARFLMPSRAKEEKLHLKRLIRLRYRWVYRANLRRFKLLRKFFKRVYGRYRKISKNSLFALRLHEHFSKLTGYSEKSLFKIWAPFRRSYNQYAPYHNTAQRFSQSLLLMPASLITFLGFTPSRAAAKQVIKSGAIFINGLAATMSRSLIPGDILQINCSAWKKSTPFFNYQRWNYNLQTTLQQLPFLQIDYAAMMFMLFRWPHAYELIAPSFLTERWLRYYIRRFPVKSPEFKAVRSSWKKYKQLPRR